MDFDWVMDLERVMGLERMTGLTNLRRERQAKEVAILTSYFVSH
jgi:hypothetical protein